MSRRNSRNRDGGRNQQFYGHDDRGRDEGGRDEGSWRGGYSGDGNDPWRGKNRRGGGGGGRGGGGAGRGGGGGGRGGFAGRDNRDTGGKWQRGRGARRKGGEERGSRHGEGGGPNPRSRIDNDDDVHMGDMDEGPTQQRYNPYGRRGRRTNNRNPMDNAPSGSMSRLGLPVNAGDRGSSYSSRGRGRGGGGRSNRGALTWAKITIPYGRKVEKDWLLTSLQNICSIPFIPLEFHYEGEMVVFYVDELATGDALRDISRRITTKTGHKVLVMTRACKPQNTHRLTAQHKETLKLCLSDRYDPSTKALNVSRLIEDPRLKAEGVSGIANRASIMEEVVKIIAKNIPEVLAIDLSDNKLYKMNTFAELARTATGLRSLNLARNSLRSSSDLDTIKDFKLEELVLEGNPVAEISNYMSTVRRYFPKVVRLDGQDLPPPIAFDVETPTTLPPVQHSFFGNSTIQKLLSKFLEQYFTVFDSGDRQQFIEIYHDQACFSMTCQNTSASNFIRKYFVQSRNLLRIKDPNKEMSLFKFTKLAVVAHLTQMPPTKHDTSSFQVDLSMVQGNLISFTLHGIYKEFNSNRSSSQLVSFSRVFLAMMQPPALCIINDHLTIRDPTHAQAKAAFASPAPTPAPSPVTVPQGSLSPAHGLTGVQQEMVAKFIKDSNMNADWSLKCLSENKWDYVKAGMTFTHLHTAGKIPVEAFVK